MQLKGIGKAKTFHQAALRNAGVVIDQPGDRPLCDYSTVDAGKVRDALISDAGIRLAEAAGLHIDDIKLNEDIPYVDIKPQPWRSFQASQSYARGLAVNLITTAV